MHARRSPKLRPIRLPTGIRGVDAPWHPLTLSRQHRVMIDAPAAELMTGNRQVLVAVHNFATPTLPHTDVSWHHILLPNHEIVRANGVWVESLFARDALSQITTQGQAAQVATALAPHTHQHTARPCLRGFEARALLAQLRDTTHWQTRNKRVA